MRPKTFQVVDTSWESKHRLDKTTSLLTGATPGLPREACHASQDLPSRRAIGQATGTYNIQTDMANPILTIKELSQKYDGEWVLLGDHKMSKRTG